MGARGDSDGWKGAVAYVCAMGERQLEKNMRARVSPAGFRLGSFMRMSRRDAGPVDENKPANGGTGNLMYILDSRDFYRFRRPR